VELEAARGFPMAVKVQFQKATLLRRDEITAVVTGLLVFEGTVHDARLSGRIDTDTVEARLITTLPQEVVELKVIEVNDPDAPVQDTVGKTPGDETSIRLAVLVRMPRQVFLRGRGLDSEWAGELSVGGTTREPIVQGVLRPVRGEFTFAGKTFKLGEGSVRFDGADRVDPTLDLAAEHKIPDLTAVIRVGGRASRPDITLTSEPPLPPSEIASRVLFGKTSGQLNPIEALQIAEAVASLSGGQSRSVLDFARLTLGVDVLRVEGGPDGAGGVGVTVGKYLTEKVYIGVSQGIGPGPGSATVEVEVTPSITLESNVGHDGRSDIGIKWRWDY
jgi:translocation and assembly module TamB